MMQSVLTLIVLDSCLVEDVEEFSWESLLPDSLEQALHRTVITEVAVLHTFRSISPESIGIDDEASCVPGART